MIAILKVTDSLLCNGDFEAYFLPDGVYAVGFPSNYSCWYERSGGYFEVQKKNGSTMTKIAELAFTSPNILCQNVTTLVIGNMYRLNFTVYNTAGMNIS